MKGDLFSHEISKTSSVFGRKKSVDVVFKGDGAATNGKTIYLPSLNQSAEVTDKQASIMRGYVDHEAGHVRHTDFEALQEFGEECAKTNNKLLRSIHNACEDVWLEKRVVDEYPGALDNLSATTKSVNDAFLKARKNGDVTDEMLSDDKFISAVSITWEGRKDYPEPSSQQCIDLLPKDIQDRLPKWVASIDQCTSTKDVITLAKIIEKEVRDAHEEKNPPTNPTNPSDEGDESDGSQGDQPRGDGSGDDADECSGQSSPQDVGDGDEDAEGNGGSAKSDDSEDDVDGQQVSDGVDRVTGSSSNPTDDVYSNFDVTEIVSKEIVGDHEVPPSDSYSYRPYDTSRDRWRTSKNYSLLRRNKADAYNDLLSRMSGDVNVMRRKLERALMAKDNRDWDGGREDGRLDTRRFVGAYNGRQDVFKKRQPRPEMDTALTVLIDLSGSMNGYKVNIAEQCAIALAEAVDKTGIAYEVLGFTQSGSSGGDCPNQSNGEPYSRYAPINMFVFKNFEQRLFECKGSMASIHSCSHGQNADGESLMYAYARLKARQEKRKVLMVLSDGQPAQDGNYVHGHYYLEKVVRDITRDGTDVIGIGIADDAVKDYYPNHVVVRSVQDLSGTALDQLSKILLGEKFSVATRLTA